MTAPALGLGPVRAPEPRPPMLGAMLVATALTLLLGLFLASGLVLGDSWAISTITTSRTAPERITFVDVPPTPLPDPEPLASPAAGAAAPGAAQPSTIAPRTPRALTPAAPRATPALPTIPPATPDTLAGAPAVPGRTASPLAPGALIPARPGFRLPPPPSAGERAAPRVECGAPCVGGARAGVSIGKRELTTAEKAERLRALADSVPALAGALGEPHLAPPQPPKDPGAWEPKQGVSIAVPLPFGGPTKAQRERDRRIHAENSAILSRIFSRADSQAVLDSLAKARRDSVAKTRRPPGGER